MTPPIPTPKHKITATIGYHPTKGWRAKGLRRGKTNARTKSKWLKTQLRRRWEAAQQGANPQGVRQP